MGIIIYLNGKKEEIQESFTISQLLETKKIRPEVVTVELNEQIVEKNKYPQTFLKTNDKLELVYFMGGGGSTQPLVASSLTIEKSNHPERARSGTTNESKDKTCVYIIRCEVGSLYTGITNNLERRLKEHSNGKGSLYMKYNHPIRIVYKEEFSNILDAERRERQIKGWTHKKKEALIRNDLEFLKRL